MPKHFNVVGPQVRRLRSAKEWSQSELAIKLQILGMETATRIRVSKIESRLACVSDDELIYLSRVLGVSTEELYPDFIRAAKHLYDAICMSKASRYGAFILGLLSCSKFGAGAVHFAVSLASV
ncbi:MAG: hypothetical protein BGO12_22045 [Verrucomicrobia bacterium 61-8]|nr:MAG: hypothetical protein BGO12_22045 [Verrucomicrobia bacterium 61-8]